MCFFQPDNKRSWFWTLSLIQDLTPCPTRIAAARMANNTKAALMRKRRHQRNQPNKIKCVMTPQGWVTVSVTQKAAFSSQLCSPGCQRQPEIHTATGMTSNSAAPLRYVWQSNAWPLLFDKSHNHNQTPVQEKLTDLCHSVNDRRVVIR